MPPSPRWVELEDQQRRAVVGAVVRLVSEGQTPLRIAALTARSGVSKPTFYKYFPTISAAVTYTAERLVAEVEAFVVPRLPVEENQREQLLARFSLGFEFVRMHPEVVRFFSYYDFTVRDTAVVDKDQAARAAVARNASDPFLQHFRAGQADGSIHPSLPVDVTFLALISSLTGSSQRLVVERSWTTGSDIRARRVHETLIAVWRRTLTDGIG